MKAVENLPMPANRNAKAQASGGQAKREPHVKNGAYAPDEPMMDKETEQFLALAKKLSDADKRKVIESIKKIIFD